MTSLEDFTWRLTVADSHIQRLRTTRWQIRIILAMTWFAIAVASATYSGWSWWVVVGVLTVHAVFNVLFERGVTSQIAAATSPPPPGPIRLGGVIMRDVQ